MPRCIVFHTLPRPVVKSLQRSIGHPCIDRQNLFCRSAVKRSTEYRRNTMLVRRIHVESALAADDNLDREPSDLELMQEHEEQRLLRAMTARRRRPLIADRSPAD
jgi:hypothetical protein